MPEDDKQQLHAIVTGRVQGVSFRYYAMLTANELRLTGWVQNLADGSVEVVAEGRKKALDRFLVFLTKGPPAAHVTHVEERWNAATSEFESFTTRYPTLE